MQYVCDLNSGLFIKLKYDIIIFYKMGSRVERYIGISERQPVELRQIRELVSYLLSITDPKEFLEA